MTPWITGLAAPAGFAAGAGVLWVAFDLLNRRALLARRLLAGGSALVALLSSAGPTGLPLWDALLRAGFAGGVVLLAGRSRPRWWVPSSVLLVLGAIGGDAALTAALAVLGVAVALASSARRMPFAGAALGAMFVPLALNLRWPDQHGASAVLAAVALVPIAVSGFRRSPRHERRVVARAAMAVGGLSAVGLLAAGVAGLTARPQLERGSAALSASLSSARTGDKAATDQHLSQAAAAFARARDASDAVWLLPARLLPALGQNVTALQEASRAGHTVALTGAETVAAADLGALRVEDGRADLAPMRELGAPLARAATSLEETHDRLATHARSPWLLWPVASRLERELTRLDRASNQANLAAEVAARLPRLMGGEGPRRYFLALQTPAEARAGGGIIGAFGEITVTDGRIALTRLGRDSDLNTQGTPPAQRTLTGPPDYLARYARFQPERVWQNVPMSPDYPAVAEVIRGLYPQSGGVPVDGVVFVSPTVVAAILGVVGPVTVAPWPDPLTAENAEHVLLHEQYVRLEGTTRTDFLGRVAEAVMGRLTSGTMPAPTALASALAPAVKSHHLVLNSADPAEQALFRRIGADGALAPVRSDFLAVVNSNAGGNKLDWFLRRTSVYKARLDPRTGHLTAQLTVTLRNESPSSGLPDYIIGSVFDPPPERGANRTYLSVYSPLALTGARLDGEPVSVESQQEAGRHVLSQYLTIPPGGTRTVVFDLAGRVVASDPYRLDLRAQALVRPEDVTVEVTAGTQRLVGRALAPLANDETLGG